MSNKKTILKPASKSTKDHIAYFQGKKPIGDVLDMQNGRRKLKLSDAAGRTEKRIINFTVNHEVVVLGLLMVLTSALALWFIVGSSGL